MAVHPAKALFYFPGYNFTGDNGQTKRYLVCSDYMLLELSTPESNGSVHCCQIVLISAGRVGGYVCDLYLEHSLYNESDSLSPSDWVCRGNTNLHRKTNSNSRV